MKLWILKSRDDELRGSDNNPWHKKYDVMLACVVRAESESRAREIAQSEGADEVREGLLAWLAPEYSTCEELLTDGEEGLIISDCMNS